MHQRGHQRGSQTRRGGNRDVAAACAFELFNAFAQRLVFAQRLAHMAEHHLAQRRQAQAVADAIKQRRAELSLQIQNLPVHRRRCDVQMLGRLANGATTHDFVKVTQNTGMHGWQAYPFFAIKALGECRAQRRFRRRAMWCNGCGRSAELSIQ